MAPSLLDYIDTEQRSASGLWPQKGEKKSLLGMLMFQKWFRAAFDLKSNGTYHINARLDHSAAVVGCACL